MTVSGGDDMICPCFCTVCCLVPEAVVTHYLLNLLARNCLVKLQDPTTAAISAALRGADHGVAGRFDPRRQQGTVYGHYSLSPSLSLSLCSVLPCYRSPSSLTPS